MPKSISMTVDELKTWQQTGVWPDEAGGRRLGTVQPDRKPALRHIPGVMNATEAGWALVLESRRIAGDVRFWAFEPLKLRLAKATYYSPDFLVVLATGAWELHEVKGFWRDDARIKIKVAADKFPMFAFRAVQWKKGQWKFEEFTPGPGPTT